ncbi:MAG: agmatine deiminase family protein [Alphaproteobacteria bacterium]|nr:agmatine deiminase family protein [Alphaproteobacteria bacterium]
MTTPSAQGYRMPAEWAPHTRCWMAWPCRAALWGGGLEAARDAYAAVARAIAAFEPVTVVARPDHVSDAASRCGGDVEIVAIAIDDSWMRDIGPTFVVDGDGGAAGVNWRFNAWGEKYDRYENDRRLAAGVLDHLGLRRFDAPFVLEGGAVHCDGEGTVITTESVLLNANRGLVGGRAAMEENLAQWLGARHVIWLPQGLAGDETDGHVDNLLCFAAPGRVLALVAPDARDPNHETLRANRAILESTIDATGRRLEVIPVEQPTLFDSDGQPMAASYLNLYIANGGIVMPVFGDARDDAAAQAVAAAFPGRRVVPVDGRPIVRGGGGIHCITQQQPRA